MSPVINNNIPKVSIGISDYNKKPLISVIIPTRERAETLFFAIQTALDQTNNDYEVIVSDNFSQDNTKEVVRNFSDSRLIYFNTGQRLSMCDNWDFALEKARGEYVIFIGDDDGIMPGAIDKLQVTIQSKPSLVYCWPRPTYVWPTNGQRASVSYLPSNAYPSEINLKKLARFVVKMGGARFTFLPSVYHGAVARSILDMIRKQTGRVFHSTQPDIFTALAIPAFADTAINVGYVVTVAGQSPKSNSAIAAYGRDGIGIANVEKFVQEYENYKIHPSLFPGINVRANLLWDSILIAMDKFPQFYNGLQFNYNAMWAYTLRLAKFDKWYISMKEILQKRSQIRYYHSFSILRFLTYRVLQEFAAFYRSLLKNNMKLGPFFKSVPDNISEFIKQLADYQKTL